MVQLPSIAVIIPTRNGSSTLCELLALLKMQTIDIDRLVIVDSSSEDDTVTAAIEYGAEIKQIRKEDFDHGGTRSEAARNCKEDILVFFTQDALPASPDSLQKLIEPLMAYPEVAMCYGRQLPRFDADFSARKLRHFNYPENSLIKTFEDRKRFGLKTPFCSNSFAAYKREKLLEINCFQEDIIFGEDMFSAAKMLEKGWKIAYAAEACVYHSHNYTLEEEFLRAFDTGVFHRSESWLLETFGRAEGVGLKFVKKEVLSALKEKQFGHAADFVLRSGLKYMGYKLGLGYNRLPLAFAQKCSMNKKWWLKRHK